MPMIIISLLFWTPPNPDCVPQLGSKDTRDMNLSHPVKTHRTAKEDFDG